MVPCPRLTSALAALLLGFVASILPASAQESQHGIAMHGDPKLPADFDHLPYANPEAPQGGRIAYAMVGSFDSLNPFILKGTAPRALWDDEWGNNLWESLMVRNRDEPFSLYGLLAESVTVPDDRSWISFSIHPQAKWADGEPVTAEDVVYSFNLLKDHGRPKTWYARVADVTAEGERTVRFTFDDGASRELPLLVALQPIFPKHAVSEDEFSRSSLTPLMGSGPYEVAETRPGTSIILKKRNDYWGEDLPVKRGFDNFDEIRLEYFRDTNTYFEAFKKGLFDYHREKDPSRWQTGYRFPAVEQGLVKLEKFDTGIPKGMNGFFMNTRKPVFADKRVRQALGYFLDFKWLNENLFLGAYDRTASYFEGSELSAIGRPASEEEKKLLAPYPDAVLPSVMDGSYRPPEGDGSGRDRDNFRKGLALLKEAGWVRQGGKIVNEKTGEPFAFEILVMTREDERLALAYQNALALVGISANVRQVDASQYWERLKSFDFDMIRYNLAFASLSPGSEQSFRWSSAAAESPGSFNFSGASDPAIDAMIQSLLSVRDRETFVAAVRALDRVLISGFYVVPLFHAPAEWVAYWNRLSHPSHGSLYGPEPTTWWSAEASQH
ncbi:extracellular solute-binding protein [Afifella sp. JA880]|uniref:extracellular solute-binding protein n=1 Tax=Afifella sp. JA880 TaxID=2975280 RepID=UPI003964852A